VSIRKLRWSKEKCNGVKGYAKFSSRAYASGTFALAVVFLG